MATLTFYGATEGVTGSAYLIQTDQATLLLECGLIQGSRKEEKKNFDPFPFTVDSVDAVVLSHGHLDHSGRLPKLVAEGYSGPIYMTSPTRDLLAVLLNDAASLQERDAEWENKRRRRSGKKKEIEPLFTTEQVAQTLPLFQGVDYGARRQILPGIEIRFLDAGHILGSSIVEIFISEQGRTRKLVFTGDLGNSCAALLRDPQVVSEADILLMESTYGDRNHRSMQETLLQFEDILEQASANGGNILIPSFAVGRTQEIIFRLGELYQRGLLRDKAIYLDSPMAIAVTDIYQRYLDLYNEEDAAALNLGNREGLRAILPTLKYSQTPEESMALNKIESGAIFIAGSGMCTGGRIRHHLKHNLWLANAHLVIVGYQAFGTLGRKLVDGAEKVRIFGEDIAVQAKIHTLGGFSAHAGQSQLLDWASHFSEPKPRMYLVHGELNAKQTLRAELGKTGWQSDIAQHGQQIEI